MRRQSLFKNERIFYKKPSTEYMKSGDKKRCLVSYLLTNNVLDGQEGRQLSNYF